MSLNDQQQLYQQIILDHGKARHGAAISPVGAIEGANVFESHQLNPTCGDEVTVRFVLGNADVVESLLWWGDGCTISMAAASVLHDTVTGRTLSEARSLIGSFRTMLQSRGAAEPDEELLGDGAAFIGVSRYPARIKCAMLSWVAFEQAIPAKAD